MFSKLVDWFDKPYRDEIFNLLERNSKFNKTRELMGLIYFFLILTLILILLIGIKYATYKSPAVYQVSEATLKNDIYHKRLLVFKQPRATIPSLQNWATRTINSMYNFDFNNFDKQLEYDKRFFTPSGYKSFVEALTQIKLKDQLDKKKQMVSIVVSEKPQILSNTSGIFDEYEDTDTKKYWQIYIPATMITTSGYSVYKDIEINIIAVMVNNNDGEAGLYIHEMDIKSKQ